MCVCVCVPEAWHHLPDDGEERLRGDGRFVALPQRHQDLTQLLHHQPAHQPHLYHQV